MGNAEALLEGSSKAAVPGLCGFRQRICSSQWALQPGVPVLFEGSRISGKGLGFRGSLAFFSSEVRYSRESWTPSDLVMRFF